MISYDGRGNCRIYPQLIGSYTYESKEKTKFQKQVLRILKRKRLPKSLEVSWLEDLLEEIEKQPEHEYSKKYDVFKN